MTGSGSGRSRPSVGARASAWWSGVAWGREEARGLKLAAFGALTLLSIVYGIVSTLVLWARSVRRSRFGVPVISVGNLVVGGTGKTPLVVYLARLLCDSGRSVAIVSRGYGRTSRGVVAVSDGERALVRWEECGDEPYLTALLTKGVGVVVARRRAAGIRYAVDKLGADAILVDDGFQHVGLARDLDILTVDAARPVGNGLLLPGGVLRENPLGVRRADLLVATRVDGAGGAWAVEGTLGALLPDAPIVETRMRPAELWDVATGEPVKVGEVKKLPAFALSSIANPSDFEATVERIGLRVVARAAFPDHHRYTDDDLARIGAAVRSAAAGVIVTTEKDAVRLTRWRPPLRLIALGIELDVVGGRSELARALVGALERGDRHGP
jgi:tetraacyldisaccharide 4'-kinase